MEKVDLRKQLKRLYTASATTPVSIEVPPLRFLMVDGQGDPAAGLQPLGEALYGVPYTLKFPLKQAGERPDFAVMPLEGLWWSDGELRMDDRASWRWTLMVCQPDWVTPEHVRQAVETAGKRRPSPALAQVRLETLAEGTCVQVLHVGPYEAEAPTIRRLHEFAARHGYRLRGKYHEVT